MTSSPWQLFRDMTTPNTQGGTQPGRQSVDSSLDPELLDSLWNFDDPIASEQHFRQALSGSVSGSTAGAELTTQLARSLGLQGRFDDATALLDAVAGTGAALPAVVRVRLSLERGRLLNSAGDPAAATGSFRAALVLAESIGEDFLAIDAAHMLAIADRERADEWTDLALRAVTRSADPRTERWAGSLHNNAGWSRHDAGDYAAALAEFEAALAAYTVHGTVEQVRVARWAVARALRSLARFDEALEIQLRLSERGPADGYVEEELAELLLATGRPNDAAQHARAAAELLGADAWFAEYEPGRLERLRQLAKSDRPD
jgi:tetratricopeptide (TPR) repeat protein